MLLFIIKTFQPTSELTRCESCRIIWETFVFLQHAYDPIIMLFCLNVNRWHHLNQKQEQKTNRKLNLTPHNFILYFKCSFYFLYNNFFATERGIMVFLTCYWRLCDHLTISEPKLTNDLVFTAISRKHFYYTMTYVFLFFCNQ